MKYRIYQQGGEYIAEIIGKSGGSSPLLDTTRSVLTVCTFKSEAEAEKEVRRRTGQYGKTECVRVAA